LVEVWVGYELTLAWLNLGRLLRILFMRYERFEGSLLAIQRWIVDGIHSRVGSVR
jgi:hypothetical protein